MLTIAYEAVRNDVVRVSSHVAHLSGLAIMAEICVVARRRTDPQR